MHLTNNAIQKNGKNYGMFEKGNILLEQETGGGQIIYIFSKTFIF